MAAIINSIVNISLILCIVYYCFVTFVLKDKSFKNLKHTEKDETVCYYYNSRRNNW